MTTKFTPFQLVTNQGLRRYSIPVWFSDLQYSYRGKCSLMGFRQDTTTPSGTVDGCHHVNIICIPTCYIDCSQAQVPVKVDREGEVQGKCRLSIGKLCPSFAHLAEFGEADRLIRLHITTFRCGILVHKIKAYLDRKTE